MRSLLLFIGSVLYPLVMVIISPMLAFLYLLFGAILLGRYMQSKMQWLMNIFAGIKLYNLHFPYKKHLVFRPKAVRLH
ncbi:MAG TPA: hypothetical protein VMR70_05685 [Flavisolibacter sp.]|nr:hypothetical protein [Flavisolibacter sp.]